MYEKCFENINGSLALKFRLKCFETMNVKQIIYRNGAKHRHLRNANQIELIKPPKYVAKVRYFTWINFELFGRRN